MAGSVNKVILIGNLGRDPEIRTTNNGAKVANFPLATSETWRDRQSGERRERTEWHRVVIFNENLIDVAERFLKKGSKVYIEGQLQTRKWQGQDGRDNYTTEIVLQRVVVPVAAMAAGPATAVLEAAAPGAGPAAPAAVRRAPRIWTTTSPFEF